MLDRLMQHGIGVGGGGSNIESIQSGHFRTSGSYTEFSIPISSVDTNKSIIILTCRTSSLSQSPGPGVIFATVEFVNSEEILLKRGVLSSTVIDYYWQVVEFKKVKSKQVGETAPSYMTSINISEVDINKSILALSFRTTINDLVGANYTAGGYLSDASTITIQKKTETILNWQVIEFD